MPTLCMRLCRWLSSASRLSYRSSRRRPPPGATQAPPHCRRGARVPSSGFMPAPSPSLTEQACLPSLLLYPPFGAGATFAIAACKPYAFQVRRSPSSPGTGPVPSSPWRMRGTPWRCWLRARQPLGRPRLSPSTQADICQLYDVLAQLTNN